MNDSERAVNVIVPELVVGPRDRVRRRDACQDPERPPTALTEFVVSCPACMIALRAATTIPPPPGEFTGWYDQRDHIRADLLERQGIVL